MSEQKSDLHIHTTASDGTYPINEIILLAKAKGIKTIAITDHDTVEAFDHLKEEPDAISVIRGLELSCDYCGSNIHILGYFVDTKNECLNKTLEQLRIKRIKRLDKIIEKLKKYGIDIDKNNLITSNKNISIGRTHIAREMVKKGYVKTGNEAFEKYIGDDMPCYEPSERLSIKEAVNLINKANGISVLAHPGLIKNNPDFEELLSFGFEGIEVFHPKHSSEQRKLFYNMATQKGLLITGGSDFHTKTRNNKIAQAYLSEAYLDKLFEYHRDKYKL